MAGRGPSQPHLIEVPEQGGPWPKLLQIARDLGAKLQRPASNSLIADVDAALGQKLLNAPKTEREPEIQPDRASNYVTVMPLYFASKVETA